MRLIEATDGGYVIFPDPETLLRWDLTRVHVKALTSCEAVGWCEANNILFDIDAYDASGLVPPPSSGITEIGIKFRSIDDAVAFKMSFA